MSDWLAGNYDWLRALHLIAMVAWMAGLFYLPRLFVYHAEAPAGGENAQTFAVMERRLLRAIMNPAMIATWLFGIAMLIANPALMSMGWMHAKLGFVIVLTALHMAMAAWRRGFAEGRNTRSARFYRIANEIPTILLILIVIMAVVEPF